MASLFDRIQKVGRFLSDKKVDIAFAGVNVAIGAAAKFAVVGALSAAGVTAAAGIAGGLAVAVAGGAATGIARGLVSHAMGRSEGKLFSKEFGRKVLLGSAISGATFGLLSGGDAFLHDTEAGQWVGNKLSSVFNAQVKSYVPDLFKGWFSRPAPVGPSVEGLIIPRAPLISVMPVSVVPEDVPPMATEALQPVAHVDSSYSLRHDPVYQAPVAPDVAPDVVTDKRVELLREVTQAAQGTDIEVSDLEALKNLQPDQVARICDVKIPTTFGAVNDIPVDCETYKADMDAGDVTIIKNINEPEPKKGLRVLFASAKEKTTSFFARAAIGDSGVIPEMTEQAMKDASPVADVADSVGAPVTPELDSDVDVTPIAESGLAEQVEEVLAEPVAEASAEPELTPQQMAQRVMQGVSYQYGN